MKKYAIYLFLFLYFQVSKAQVIKSDVVLGTNEEGTAIRGIAKKTVPIDPTYGVFGYNLATNSNGYGVGGNSAGSGVGVYGTSQSGTGGYFTSSSGYALITGSGNVGLGVNTPLASLEVARGTGINGTAAFQGTTNISHFNYSTSENTFLRGGKATSNVIINDFGNNVAIGNGTPLEKLHVFGNIRSSSLAGTGVRNVYADINGNLISTAQTNYLILGPSNFILSDNNGTGSPKAFYGSDILVLNSTGLTSLNAPLTLPNNATIINISFCFTDQESTRDLDMQLKQYDVTNNLSSTLAQLTSSGSGSTRATLSSTLNHIFDANSDKFYYISINSVTNNTTINNTWTNFVKPVFVKITYNL